ncbi:MAG TPA: bifunctional heptose 7-phosphate kinase/heptose 1-phosphate adenyltransferase [Planctomycetota bacterium]|nr:bifunctional heptose 7-phosphate kinase/heptose 1-phosphate adenyltransferase [Planctomycetota bacterium]
MRGEPARLIERLASLGSPRVGIVGDLILDRYVGGEVHRISPEAPIQVFEEREEEDRLGGAGNVVANLAAMGARVRCLGVVGRDDLGRSVLERLRGLGAHARVVVDRSRPTPRKTRYVAGVQQVLRADRERVVPIRGAVLRSVLRAIPPLVRASDVLVLSDYGKGVCVDAVFRALVAAARRSGKWVLVDPKERDFARYRGAQLITPNRAEAERASGVSLGGRPGLDEAARRLMRRADLEAIVITLGKDGVYYRTRGGASKIVPTQARQVFDVTGAGDTMIAHLALHLAAGAPLDDALALANVAAGVVVGKLGAASATREEILAHLAPSPADTEAKIVRDRSALDRLAAAWRRDGKRIVFTNGCFDLLHSGHLALLRAARRRGDVLVVGVNDDASVRRLKGAGRPINPLEERMAVLGGLAAVDAVVPFREGTPESLIRRLTPHVLVKGADWADRGVVGRAWVEAHGGTVVLEDLKRGRSTSETIRRILARENGRRAGRTSRRGR